MTKITIDTSAVEGSLADFAAAVGQAARLAIKNPAHRAYRAKKDLKAFQVLTADDIEPLTADDIEPLTARSYPPMDPKWLGYWAIDDGDQIDLLQKRTPTFTFDIEAEPFERVVFMKSRQTGLTAYREFEKRLADHLAASFGMTYAEVRAQHDAVKRASDYADARRYAQNINWWLINSTYGKFGYRGGAFMPDARTPALFTNAQVNTWPPGVLINPVKDPNDMSIIPPLDVPEAPKPDVAPAAPESASVQILRKLLEQRQEELQRFTDAKDNDEKFAASLEAKLERVRNDIASHDRGITAAKQAIEEIEVDIALLKGSTASVKVDSNSDLVWITWPGGDCPVNPKMSVHVRRRDGIERFTLAKAVVWRHAQPPADSDIVTYAEDPLA